MVNMPHNDDDRRAHNQVLLIFGRHGSDTD